MSDLAILERKLNNMDLIQMENLLERVLKVQREFVLTLAQTLTLQASASVIQDRINLWEKSDV